MGARVGMRCVIYASVDTVTEEHAVNTHVYKIIELVGSSTQSSDDAIRRAIGRAAETMRHLDWYEVVENRGHIVNGTVAHYQVKLRVGFRLEEPGHH